MDVARLVTRLSRPTPNGIDRVDLAFAHHFVCTRSHAWAIMLNLAGPRAIPGNVARILIETLDWHWRENENAETDTVYNAVRATLLAGDATTYRGQSRYPTRIGPSLARLRQNIGLSQWRNLAFGAAPRRVSPAGAVYLNVSQFPIWVDSYFQWLRHRTDIKPVFLLHDLLPLQYPEFFPTAEYQRHQRRLEVLGRRAAGIIVTSDDNRLALLAHLKGRGGTAPPIVVAALPVANPTTTPDHRLAEHTYFVMLGTLEPRKNHLLLLNIWRQLAIELGPRTPKLLVIGSRGWEDENVLAMLNRCESLRQHVIWASGLSTPAVRKLLLSARSLLMPSFAEGYGLPVAEALALGVRAIASNIAAFSAMDHPNLQLVDVLDGPAWTAAIKQACLPQQSATTQSRMLHSCALFFDHIENFIATI